jgi:hypothetical protein
MVFFRLYPLDDRGRYSPPIEVDGHNDADMLASAAQLGAHLKGDFDVWQLRRFVGRFHLDENGKAVPTPDQPRELDQPA